MSEKQFSVSFTFDIATETPEEALELAVSAVTERSGSCWVVIEETDTAQPKVSHWLVEGQKETRTYWYTDRGEEHEGVG
jgi:hypothetical protein